MGWNRSDYMAAALITIIVAAAVIVGLSMLGIGQQPGGFLPFK